MHISSIWFGSSRFKRLSTVLEYTIKKNCPNWSYSIDYIADNKQFKKSKYASSNNLRNTQKMYYWNSIIQSSPLDKLLLLIDSDTIIINSIDEIKNKQFDLAYTTKKARFPLNSGVVFARISPLIKTFFNNWYKENVRLLRDGAEHAKWKRKYGGINQAAFGYMLANKSLISDLKIVQLPCRIWNCEDSSWPSFKPNETKIIHVKSALRRSIFDGEFPRRSKKIDILKSLWESLEKEAIKNG